MSEDDFWTMRRKLWPQGSRRGVDSYDCASLRSELRKMKRNSRVLDTLETWALQPEVRGFQGIVGSSFDFEREVLGFWIPFAWAYAKREYQLQQDRSDPKRKPANTLKVLLKEAEELASRFREIGGVFHHAMIWKDTPFLPLNARWETLRSAGYSFGDELEQLKANCEDIIETVDQQVDAPHGNTRFLDRALATILGLCWTRLFGTEPTAANLIDFNVAVVLTIDPKRVISEDAIKGVHAAQRGKWAEWTDMATFVNLTESFWMEDIVMKISDPSLRSDVESAMVDFIHRQGPNESINVDWIS